MTLADALRWGVSKGWVVYPIRVDYSVATYKRRNALKTKAEPTKPQRSQ